MISIRVRSPSKKLFRGVLVGAVYFAAAKLGFLFTIVDSSVSSVWLPAGIALAAFFLQGKWVWPAIFLGAVTANLSNGAQFPVAIGIGMGNTLGPFIGVKFLLLGKKFRPDFSKISDVIYFSLFGILLAPLISSVIGVLSLWFGGMIPSGEIATLGLSWWSGDAVGVMVIAPVCLYSCSMKWKRLSSLRIFEAVFLVGSFTGCAVFIFTTHELLNYLIYPFGLWGVLRFGQAGIMGIILILASVSIPLVILKAGHEGILGTTALQVSVYRLQLFLSTAWLTGMILAATRAAEKRLAREKALSSEAFRSNITNSMQDGFSLVDANGIQSDVNPAFCRMTGFSRDELIGSGMPFPYWPPEGYECIQASFSQLMEDTESPSLELVFMRKNGERFPVIVSPSAVKDVFRNVTGYMATVKDITERKRMEDNQKIAQELLRNISNRVPGMVYQFILRPDGSSYFPFMSESIRQILRLSPEDVREDAAKAFSLVHPDDLDGLNASIQKSADDLAAWTHRFRIKFDDGTVRWIFGNAVPERARDGCTLWHGFMTDVTEQKHLEATLENAKAAAEHANRTKDRFLATLSHELRTPLTTILSWAQMLRRGKLSEKQIKHGIEVVEQSALAQGQLIDDLLDISRIQAGKLRLSIQKIDPRKVISAAVDSVQNLAGAKSIQIETSVDPSVETVLADPVRLQQILWNLISNSIKFSEPGSKIWISLGRIGTGASERIRIQVRDTGKGIKPEFMSTIFQRFTQADSTSTRAYGGLGLGLAIVKNLVEMHEGSVEVDSPGSDQGATFTLYFPVKMSASSQAAAPGIDKNTLGSVGLEGLRIFLVEDQANAREVFSMMLQSFGAEVHAAGSVSEALSGFEGFRPDVLVSDIAMPGEDGYSLIAKIRKMSSKWAQTPALALTAYAGAQDIQRAHLAGFQAHMAKPVDGDKLARAVAALAGRQTPL